jgi:ABC-type thiamine transport system ATPase subunit
MPETAIQPYIEFREVCKAFGDKVVLDRVSFNVMPGETVCILGRSGVGKSVSLQLLMGFLKADSGRVIVAGEDITGFSEEQLEAIRKKVTMVFQNGALFRLTHGGRECGVCAARNPGVLRGADLPDRRWLATNGGRKGNARPVALRPLDRE